jgi:hypothetical protein
LRGAEFFLIPGTLEIFAAGAEGARPTHGEAPNSLSLKMP